MTLTAVTPADPMPSWRRSLDVGVITRTELRDLARSGQEPLGVPVIQDGEAPPELGLDRDALRAAGFDGTAGQTLVRHSGPDERPMVAYGVGAAETMDAAALRDAAGALALAVDRQSELTVLLPDVPAVRPEVVAQVMVEGAALARYDFEPLKREPRCAPLTRLTLVTAAPQAREAASRGATRGRVLAKATALARDLANAPPNLLTAARMAECATRLAAAGGLRVEAFDREALVALGCGGLLGVNAGSSEPPRMIKLTYEPETGNGPPGAGWARLTLVGKGIMYDSGGISLKPSDAVHATMKNDMSGAAAILAAMAVLRELDCPTAVTGYLMCTDNMPSGTATKLGDVLTIRGGTTVEVINTDAEGRLVMADALVLATEEATDAIVDIATLTGACLRALGAEIAGVFGNSRPLVDQTLSAAAATGEPAWQLPLAARYRGELDSDVADIKNMGGPNGAAIHAALFLSEFVDEVPWAHIDIAGPAQNDIASGWRPKGCTGFGARLLAELATGFQPPGR